MIVMKFGGSSLESAEAIARVIGIVKAQAARRPVVVVSAMGKTTDRLFELAAEAEHGHSYCVWKLLRDLQDFHIQEASQLITGDAFDSLEQALHKQFTDLHRLIFEATDEGREFTPQLRDQIISLGEIVASQIVTAVFNCAGEQAIHIDARKVIVTDNRFTRATPMYWETFARLRRTIPCRTEYNIAVMGGYIGATEAGITTTLGRGGSDLTASLVGAGISADEVQIWTDVDGVLSCDPRVCPAGFRVRSMSYGEATALARAGAKVLHPDSVQPAVRQRIPIVIRNSRHPECEGTRIAASAGPCNNPIKSIACRSDVTVLELRPSLGAADIVAREHAGVEFIADSGDAVYLAINGSECFDHLPNGDDQCVTARVFTERGLITLVGEGVGAKPSVAARALAALKGIEAFVIMGDISTLAITIVVPRDEMVAGTEALHREFFKEVDGRAFADNGQRERVTSVRQEEIAASEQTILQKRFRWVLARQH